MQPRPLTIGLFTWDIGGYYYGAMLSGIHQVTRAAGVPLLIIQSELKDIRMPTFGAEYVAGWIALHPSQDAAANLVALVASGVPVITVATRLDDVACTSVVADNRGGTRMLVNHLLDHGHRQIAYIDHGKESWSYERYLGYLDALQDHAIALDPSLIIDIAYIHADLDAPRRLERCGEVTARELIARGLPCTALVAGTDRSAIAAIQVLQDAGYHVPEDIAVVGFDDVAEAQFAQPPLTTVRTHFDQLGRIAAEELLAVLRGEHDPHPRRIYAPSSVLRRRSCGCVGLTAIQERGTRAVATAVDWQPMLAKQLVQLICYPLASDLDTPPTQLWPGVSTLIAAVDALLQGQETAGFAADIDAAWRC
jgi:DNA-binding LacI/PurR family transcriptional regulator